MSVAGRASLFDASALVKVYTDEPGSEIVRQYFKREPTKYTTPFCFYEALSILKAKWKYRNELTAEKYLEAARRLTAWYGASSRGVDDLDFASQ
jgi:predicted nucleic acid-binding protein